MSQMLACLHEMSEENYDQLGIKKVAKYFSPKVLRKTTLADEIPRKS